MVTKTTKSSNRSRLVLVVVAGLLLYVVLPQISAFNDSFAIVKQADPSTIGIAIGFSLLTYIAAANTYYILSIKKLKYLRTILAQTASMFVNRLLPGGIGSIGANYVYLRKSQHTVAQAASVVTANNLLGLVGHILLSAVLLVTFNNQLPNINIKAITSNSLLVIGAITVTILLLIVLSRQKNRFQAKIREVGHQLTVYIRHPIQVFGALASSISLTLFNIACLYFCMLSLDIHLSFVIVMLIFTLGVAVGTATPTPGGLGGVEAGLVAGFIAAGIPSSTALAIALTYRFIHYWLSLAIGGVGFVICRKRGYM